MQGKIIKGIGGFYYVYVEGEGVLSCKARGIFRREGKKPLVGDNVEVSMVHEKDREGSLDRILPRKNELIRPASANVDQAFVVFAAAKPEPNLNLLDRFLLMMAKQDIPVVIGFNKADLIDEKKAEEYRSIYAGSGCRVLSFSVAKKEGLDELHEMLAGKTTVLAGPSGVGKSSLTNYLQPEASMEVGEISRKIERGKNTTRHTQLVHIAKDTYFMDTPGFSSLYLNGIEYEQLPFMYPEFTKYEPDCRFQGCMHLSEPDCAVKEALGKGDISSSRYENYCLLAEELKEKRRQR